jgi:hypothetical protein
MNWSGTAPIPDDERVAHLRDELRTSPYWRVEPSEPRQPRRDETDPQADWIVWVAIAICLLVPLVAWISTL